MTVTTALYRRYRPDSFADVIGQEHVTEPLMMALRKNRVNHAYLFSGPRGCGKTTSARILARCLNCAEGPTDTPCGKCPSCVGLARGGSGSLDVIEIDAASHGGVDDARDLRERATYAPVRDRYKIFIIDEAHMVTSAGFNALLKIVEEPPEHIKFIFATTEPDKVIGTIRSRTHHYPFRLVPPAPLMAYLELLCTQENVPVAPGVLSLVIRAGGGSVRDSLSVLDQLMAGAGPEGLDYELAVALLGYTHASLLDDVVEAVAAADAATVFRAVDRVVQTGHDPRRFVEDLLERFRDLIIVQAMPESAQSILRGMPADQIARLQNQAHNLGASELSRAADVTNTALTEMTGATSPRLHLELLCARILLPSSEQTERGIAARIDRVERRLNYAGNDVGTPVRVPAPGTSSPTAAPTAAPAPPAGPAQADVSIPASGQGPAPQAAPSAAPVAASAPAPEAAPAPAPAPDDERTRQPLTAPRVSTSDWPVDKAATGGAHSGNPAPAGPVPAAPAAPSRVQPEPVQPAPVPARPEPSWPTSAPEAPGTAAVAPAVAPAPGSGADVEVLRRAWPDILQTLTKIKRSTWALVEPNAQVGHFEDHVLTLAFTTSGLAGAFGRADHAENLRQAIHKTIGIDCQVKAVAAGAHGAASSEPNPKAPASRDIPAASADVAWGLAPDSRQIDSPAVHAAGPAPVESPGAGQAATEQPSPSNAAEVPAPAAASPAPAEPPAVEARPVTQPSTSAPAVAAAAPASLPAQPSPAPADSSSTIPATAPATPAEAEGSYAYPDDDWGPPRDEDAPPLDEDPPMDWDPQASAARLPAEPETPAAPARKKATAPKPASAAPSRKSAAPQGPDTAEDPWTRAVEQSAGIWTVGSETNVGRSPAEAEPAAIPEHAAEPDAPHYEPAAAQIPAKAVTASCAAGVPEAPDASGVSADGWGEPEPAPAAVTVPAAAPASAATVAAIAAPVAATAVPVSPGRQSLYQRLSNSPEAEAGRAKAPARASATATLYANDVPSADDETIEESGVFGRAAVERILGGKLVEERSLDGSPLPPRF
ncbi:MULTISPECIES: DNA polymerase III subunit gamma and tau [Arthrobacter]|uniref:DNA polymerase III subunit gamma/tau n=1 Tax=Arthrobacter oryzae TaxID=409290 RepID=A0A3N0BMI9_9MICC|nr:MULTISPECIES: DNA polymerase III subunit gamma and tau [Arthrobacter]QYF88613.1 DNA polymerase III subunit gamma and tau [Arthrobacter sp. PAMC25284]RNL49959.1 DNA polymerase III subunit gamma and tau [Arthrobacter oryzae]